MYRYNTKNIKTQISTLPFRAEVLQYRNWLQVMFLVTESWAKVEDSLKHWPFADNLFLTRELNPQLIMIQLRAYF